MRFGRSTKCFSIENKGAVCPVSEARLRRGSGTIPE